MNHDDITPILSAYLTETALELKATGRFKPATWDSRPLVPDSAIVLEHQRHVLAWTPTTGWFVLLLHRSETPGRIGYLGDGPVPVPTLVASKTRAWLDGDIVLSATPPRYKAERSALPTALRDAVRQGGIHTLLADLGRRVRKDMAQTEATSQHGEHQHTGCDQPAPDDRGRRGT